MATKSISRSPLTAQGEVLLKPLTGHVDDVFGRLSQSVQKVLTPGEMDAAIAQQVERTAGRAHIVKAIGTNVLVRFLIDDNQAKPNRCVSFYDC